MKKSLLFSSPRGKLASLLLPSLLLSLKDWILCSLANYLLLQFSTSPPLHLALKPTSYRAAHQNFCFFPSLPFFLSYFTILLTSCCCWKIWLLFVCRHPNGQKWGFQDFIMFYTILYSNLPNKRVCIPDNRVGIYFHR